MTTLASPDLLKVDNFWAWALAQWSDPILAAEMMALQEGHDCVVLELLLMGWLGRQHLAISSAAHGRLVEMAVPWLEGVVIPLRHTRRAWRGIAARASERQKLQSLELKCEYALAELYFRTLELMEPSELGLVGESRVIDNLGIALASAAPPVDVERIRALGALLSK
jgi:uncharacterized protein (TIGR02444 family)